MKNSILKIALIVFLFSACDSNTSSEKKTDTPTTKTAESTAIKTPTAETPSETDAVKEIENTKQATTPSRNEIQDYYGMYMYMADANSFSSCDDKTKMSIATKGKYLDLERKYLTVADGGDKVFIHFKGKIEKGRSMEGKTKEMLVISELMEVDKAKRCD